jgi:hypothetical protein
MPPPPQLVPLPAPIMMDVEAPMMAMDERSIVVTGARMEAPAMRSAVVTAEEEDLGDLKLFRVPGRVEVSAKGMKQVAFLDKEAVKARLLYEAECDAWNQVDPDPASVSEDETEPASLLLVTKNEAKKGLGIALPQGKLALFEPTSRGDMLAGRTILRDYARGQDVELELGTSAQVYARCGHVDRAPGGEDARKWSTMRAVLTNANPHPITLRMKIGEGGEYEIRFPGRKVELKNGWQTVELTVPANTAKPFDWTMREATRE